MTDTMDPLSSLVHPQFLLGANNQESAGADSQSSDD